MPDCHDRTTCSVFCSFVQRSANIGLRVPDHLLLASANVWRGLRELMEPKTLIFLAIRFGLGGHAEQDGRAAQAAPPDDDHAQVRRVRAATLIAVRTAFKLAVA